MRNSAELLSKTRTHVDELYTSVQRYSLDNNFPLDLAARLLAVERVASGIRVCR